jgi:phosphoribosylamine--glycine ligase
VVIKADGLAAGKGVVIARTDTEAREALESFMTGRALGDAGSRVVIEEFLEGEEVSFIALTDGTAVVPLEPTQDHKAVHDNDAGPNTGGMGAYCDSRIITAGERRIILNTIIHPTIAHLRHARTPFTGFLYAGLMMTSSGPRVLEFNVRLGDPETQPLMARISGDIVPALYAAATGNLASAAPVAWSSEPSTCVVLAAHGYPGAVRTGDPVTGIVDAERSGALVFHAGTTIDGGILKTSGGRVLGVTVSGVTLPESVNAAYSAARSIHFDGMHFRTDVGRKGIKRWQ